MAKESEESQMRGSVRTEINGGIIVTHMKGEVTRAVADEVLRQLREYFKPQYRRWLIDCLELESYTAGGIAGGIVVIIEAKKLLDGAEAKKAAKFEGSHIVVVATKPTIRMAVHTVSLRSQGRLKLFDELDQAHAHLRSVARV